MKVVKTIALGSVGMAALIGAAAPAAAQYPGYGGGPYGYSTDTIGQVLQSILNPYGQFGYNRGVNPQIAVNQCTAAVQQRLARQYQAGYGGQYAYGGQWGGQPGYGQPYGQPGYGGQYGYNPNANSNARVLGITRVEQRSSSTIRVRGVATSGMMYAYGGNPYGGNPYAGNQYGGYANPYGGYPSPYGGYAQQAQAPADLTFRCEVDYRGYVRDIDIDRRR